MTDRNRELVPDSCNLRQKALTTGLCSERWYSEHSGVCRRTELPGTCRVLHTCKVWWAVGRGPGGPDLGMEAITRHWEKFPFRSVCSL